MKSVLGRALFAVIGMIATIPVLVAEPPTLRPPAGAKVAIVVFQDLQCPKCAVDWTLLQQAGKTYKIPVVLHDFPLPMHSWSFQAAVNARWFDAKSKKLGNAYRGYIFEHQPEITPENLRPITEQFAGDNKLSLPLFVDPKGTLAAMVRDDAGLGQRLGINHTPTVYIVSNTSKGPSSVEVQDDSQLYTLIDSAMSQAVPSGAPKPRTSARKAQ